MQLKTSSLSCDIYFEALRTVVGSGIGRPLCTPGSNKFEGTWGLICGLRSLETVCDFPRGLQDRLRTEIHRGVNYRPQRRDLWAFQSVSGFRLSNECGVWIENPLPTLPLLTLPLLPLHSPTLPLLTLPLLTLPLFSTASAHSSTAHSSTAQHCHCSTLPLPLPLLDMYTAIARPATATASNQHLLLQLTSTWRGFLPPRSSSGAHSNSSDAVYGSFI